MNSEPKFRFMEVQVGAVETDPTQWDQFNTDELTAAEAVMRESHQNSLDAGSPGATVRTRISVHNAKPGDADFLKTIFEPLVPHLKACGSRFVPDALAAPRFLVVEDFGTTGLAGSWNKTDTLNFSDFWRRFGNSHKSGSSGGSWGLGKLSYPATSVARTFFGVTIRKGEDQPLLMGQTVLQHHDVGAARYVPFGFFSTLDPSGLQIPILDKIFIKRFSEAVGFSRTNEPGLSIAVPFVPAELSEETLIPALLRNYFFPILTGMLEIEIGGVSITRETFGDAVKQYGGKEFEDGSLEAFIRALHKTRQEDKPDATFGENWIYGKVEDALDAVALKKLRDKLSNNEMVHVRVPLKVRDAKAKLQAGWVDVVFKLGGEGQKPRGLFVRNAITINEEARKKYKDKMAFAALIAADGIPAQVLRASENPAHTEWNPRAQSSPKSGMPMMPESESARLAGYPASYVTFLCRQWSRRTMMLLSPSFRLPIRHPNRSPSPHHQRSRRTQRRPSPPQRFTLSRKKEPASL
jgi:hypothetical protein